MRTFVSITFLAFSLFLPCVKSASETVQGHAPSPDRCPDAKVLNSSSFPVKGGNVTIAHFSCDHTSSLVSRSPGRISSARATTLELKGRDASECTSDECKCGETCVATCNKLTTLAPTVSNCNTIAQSIKILATNNAIGQTFFVDPGNSVLIFFSDCEFEWDNIGKATIEYCWDDFINIESAIETSCLAIKGNTGASCVSVGNDFQLSFKFA
ncbi:hypothetical protein BV25DRAFT_191928 [Artomyces pyxidatus]|uniref:Uncharacterized protein n=1 Tax=Artomyces pyxidatus TaxID=48021 RepID=A0ACB8T9K0_9AGAM|nr:hypothetical protein BV25DRAFT_191928 [Artomyces pyxidatus]